MIIGLNPHLFSKMFDQSKWYSHVFTTALQLLLTILLLLELTNASISVPVVVSTVSRATPVQDVTFDANDNVLLLPSHLNGVFRMSSSGGAVLLAGSGSSTTGTSDGVGSVARFYLPQGITTDDKSNIAYISDTANYRIRMLTLATNTVRTLAGSSEGHRDAVGTAAQFYSPVGIVFHSSGILYVAEFSSVYLRKIDAVTGTVSTVASVNSNGYYNLCINSVGTLLYVTTVYTVVQVTIATGEVVVLAGGTAGYVNGVGLSARFNHLQGIALNNDGTLLIIADQTNQRIRRLELATCNVTTIAGSGATGFADGPGLTAKFANTYGMKWHCNFSMALCGVLAADFTNSALRFVTIEQLPTTTAALSAEATASASASTTSSPSSVSNSLSTTALISRSSTQNLSSTVSMRRSASPSRSTTFWLSTSSSHVSTFSHSTVASATFSLSISMKLSLTSSKSNTMSPLRTLSALLTSSRTEATKSSSGTRQTSSKSSTIYCALVAKKDAANVGNLHTFRNSGISQEVIPLVAFLRSNTTAAPAAAPIQRSVLLQNVPLGINLTFSLGGTVQGGTADAW